MGDDDDLSLHLSICLSFDLSIDVSFYLSCSLSFFVPLLLFPDLLSSSRLHRWHGCADCCVVCGARVSDPNASGAQRLSGNQRRMNRVTQIDLRPIECFYTL